MSGRTSARMRRAAGPSAPAAGSGGAPRPARAGPAGTPHRNVDVLFESGTTSSNPSSSSGESAANSEVGCTLLAKGLPPTYVFLSACVFAASSRHRESSDTPLLVAEDDEFLAEQLYF